MNKRYFINCLVFCLLFTGCAQLQSFNMDNLTSGDVERSIKSLENGSTASLDLNGYTKEVDKIADTTWESPQFGEIDVSTAANIGQDLYDAAALSDEEVSSVAQQAARHSDQQNSFAPKNSSYATRLAKLTRNHTAEQSLNLNFKVYLSEDINAFALADGSIRIYSGLMDVMTDEELQSVIGHEIGHVKLGHSKKALQVAYAASAAMKGASASATTRTAVLGTSVLGKLAEEVINAQFSQQQEKEADDYGLRFMMRHRYNTRASISALIKLAELNGEHSLLSSHPNPEARAERLDEIRTDYLEMARKRAAERKQGPAS